MPLKRQRGFSLTEVLVALVVLSIGLLGLAGLQIASLRSNHSAYLRAVAVVLTYDMADRMRANRVGVDAGHYDEPAAIEHANCTSAADCSVGEMAEHDAYEWTQAIADQLPSGQGIVCIDSTPDDGTPGNPGCDGSGTLYAIKLWWDDDRSGNLTRFVTVFRP